jgi:cell wall assembly regulator SMI1
MDGNRHWPLITVAATVLVAAIAIVPRLLGGSWTAAGSAAAACPARYGMRNTSSTPVRDGAKARMVPGAPSGAVICRYQSGMLQHAENRFVGSRPLADATAFATRLNGLPKPQHTSFACLYAGTTPFDLLLFDYPDGQVQGVWIDHGCSVIGNGRRTAVVTRDLLAPLDAQFPPAPVPRPSAVPFTARPTPTPTPSPLTPAQMAAIGCAPVRRSAPPVRPDPAVRAATDRAWARIESWLRVHAPATYATLRSPASPAEIQTAEAALGRTFPDDVISSLLRHNGVTSAGYRFTLPYTFSPSSTTQIVSTWKMLCGITRTMHDLSGSWWHGRLVPIGEDGTGVTLVADPAAHGKVGEADDENGLEFDAYSSWPSYLSLLQTTAHALETGTAVRDFAPEVRSGGLDWKSTYKPTRRPTMIPTKSP